MKLLAPRSSLRPAAAVTSAVTILAVWASLLGVMDRALYPDVPWAAEAMRGGDLVTLVVAVPLLVVAMTQALRGSGRAAVLWIGMLWYLVYAYAFYVVGAEFNDLFLVHVSIVVGSATALGLLLHRFDVSLLGSWLAPASLVRPVAGFLLVVAAFMAGLWSWISLQFAVTGELPDNVPADGFHTVFAVDLCLLVPSLVLSGVLLWRRAPAGYALAAAVSAFGAVYQLNLMSAGIFQAAAGVPDVTAVSVQGVVLTLLFAGSAWALMAYPGTAGPATLVPTTREIVTNDPSGRDLREQPMRTVHATLDVGQQAVHHGQRS